MRLARSRLLKLQDCDVCENRRYLICHRDDGFLAVERCDNCSVDKLYDEDAARLAQKAGVKCKNTYPCYLTDKEDPSLWETVRK